MPVGANFALSDTNPLLLLRLHSTNSLMITKPSYLLLQFSL